MRCRHKRLFLSIIISISAVLAAVPQEVLIPLTAGPPNPETKKSTKAEVPADTLEIPFFDDFSHREAFPRPRLWTDRYAFINNSYTLDPVTVGVATMDAIDDEGNLNGSSQQPFESDFLTSMPINLEYPGRQDLWMSFFYQPMGLGDEPESWDSLNVEFLAPGSTEWEPVWSLEGSEADTFRQVFIPITEERFLKKGFRFRFKNYASLPRVTGYEDKNKNVDHWNIDYVYIDTARSSSVTALTDVSMISSLGSLLKTYQSMPWRHFFPKAYLQELKPTVDISYRNNDTTTRNATRVLKITDLTYNYTDSVNGGAVNVAPGVLNTFSFPYNYPFIFYDQDSASFEVRSYLVTEDLDYKPNDTIVRIQKFHNYYAYDDGSAENGYGLRGEGTANAAVACRFFSYKEDTLRGVKMHFNRTLNDYSQNYFMLGVWEHNPDLDAPGRLIYKMQGVRPEYPGGINSFYTYRFDTLLIVEDEFYVGWIKTTERMLNVGWDAMNDHGDKIYYNLGQEWVNTIFKGSLMVRPVLGPELAWPVSERPASEINFRVSPNPASSVFSVELPANLDPGMDQSASWMLSLYNLQGKLVYFNPIQTHRQHYIGDLPEGLYILRLSQGGVYRAGSKLMILR